MGMLGSLINKEVVQQAASERTLWQHTLHGMTEHLLYTTILLAKLSGCIETLTTRITCVTGIDLVSLFLTSKYHLIGIDKDHVVTAVNMRGESWLVLSANELCYLRSETTNNLVCGIDNHPLLLRCFLVHGNSLVT